MSFRDRPPASVEMEAPGFKVFRDPSAPAADIAQALEGTLERIGNVGDCFWVSHAWAESLIQGRTVEKRHFPENGVEIRRDALWKKDQPGYKGTHVSHGAESYLITNQTKGRDGALREREYQRLGTVDTAEELTTFLDTLPNGRLVMVLTSQRHGEEGHAVLATRLNGTVFVIDNAFEPGAWIRSKQEYVRQHGDRQYAIYLYPEKIHGL